METPKYEDRWEPRRIRGFSIPCSTLTAILDGRVKIAEGQLPPDARVIHADASFDRYTAVRLIVESCEFEPVEPGDLIPDGGRNLRLETFPGPSGACAVNEHTPGPWTAEKCEHDWSWYVRNDTEVLAHVGTGLGMTRAMIAANARLVAAGPELLAACEAIVKMLNGDPAYKACELAMAAIAKAKGTSQPA